MCIPTIVRQTETDRSRTGRTRTSGVTVGDVVVHTPDWRRQETRHVVDRTDTVTVGRSDDPVAERNIEDRNLSD